MYGTQERDWTKGGRDGGGLNLIVMIFMRFCLEINKMRPFTLHLIGKIHSLRIDSQNFTIILEIFLNEVIFVNYFWVITKSLM